LILKILIYIYCLPTQNSEDHSLVVRNGVVKYADGQIGKENVKHLENMKPQTVKYVRLDNTKPNDKVLNAVKNRRM
jgi:hypothetical protein